MRRNTAGEPSSNRTCGRMRAFHGLPSRAIPLGRVGDAGVLEFIHRQVFRLALDREIATRADAPRHGEIARDAGGVVAVVELLFHRRGDVDAPHLQERRRAHRCGAHRHTPTRHRFDRAVEANGARRQEHRRFNWPERPLCHQPVHASGHRRPGQVQDAGNAAGRTRRRRRCERRHRSCRGDSDQGARHGARFQAHGHGCQQSAFHCESSWCPPGLLHGACCGR